MGLIKAAVNATLSVMEDTWKDYFVCDGLDSDTLMVKGVKKGSKGLFGNNNDIITNGSGIVVADGQCALIVEDGKILEVANETGYYTFDSEKSPSVFDGGFSGIANTFKEIGKRFTYGGNANVSQCIYYVNTKEVLHNLFGTPNPIPFRVIDKNIGLDVDIAIRCNGEYSFKITNPLLFYTNVAGNSTTFEKGELLEQLKSELLTALQPAFALISQNGVRYSEVPLHTIELVQALNDTLNQKWRVLRGIEIVSLGINSLTASKEDEEMIKNLQKSAVFKDPSMAAATLVGAQADAMRSAASNANGAMTGFMGLNMANQAGGADINALYNQSSKATQGSKFCSNCGAPLKETDRFCPNCGHQVN